jgi:hypothetical protein
MRKKAFQWKIKNQISKDNLILLDSEYKKSILEDLPEIIIDLKKEDLVIGYDLLHLTQKGRDLVEYFFKNESQNKDNNDNLNQKDIEIKSQIYTKKSKHSNILEKFFQLNRITLGQDKSEIPIDHSECVDRGNRKDISHPKFKLGDRGVVLCKTHPKYELLKRGRLHLDNICRSCIHYKINDCFFPSGIIQIVQWEINTRYRGFPPSFASKYKCDICGKGIECVSNILYKYYVKEFRNIEILQFCCKCNRALKKGKD